MKWVFGILLVVLVAFLLVRAIPMKPTQTKTSRTLVSILSVLHNFDAAENDEEKAQLFLMTDQDSLTLNRKVTAFLVAQKDHVEPLQFVNGILVDAWQNPLLFATSNAVAYQRLNPFVKEASTRPFVVWSTGPNGTNDWGFFDDVSIHK